MGGESGVEAPKSEDQKALDELHSRKQELMSELRQLEKTIKTAKTGEVRQDWYYRYRYRYRFG